jgi:uncharacterized membrane protein YagU involved in acid resistance
MSRINTLIIFLLMLLPITVMGMPMHPIDYCTNYHMNMPFNMVDYIFGPIALSAIFAIMFVMLDFVVPNKHIGYGIMVSTSITILSFTIYPLIYGDIPSLMAGIWKVTKVLITCIH